MKKPFKARVRSGEPMLLIDLGAGSAGLVPALAASGIEALFIDCEEDQFGVDEVAEVARRAHLAGMVTILRPPSAEPQRLHRYLRAGVDGLMIAHVEYPDEVDGLVASIRAARPKDADGVVLIIMIESVVAAGRMAEFVKRDEVDVIFCGAGDLGVTMGIPDKGHPEVRRKVAEIMAAAVAGGRTAGRKALPEDIDECLASGARLLVMSVSELLERQIAASLPSLERVRS